MRCAALIAPLVPALGALVLVGSCALVRDDQAACDAVGAAWHPVIATAGFDARTRYLNRLDSLWGRASERAATPELQREIAGAASRAHGGQAIWFGSWTQGMEGVRDDYEAIRALCDELVDASGMPLGRTPRADAGS